MTTLSIPPGRKFTVLSADTVRHNYVIYKGVTKITYPDGTTKTCAQLIEEAGGENYTESEVKKCVRVEGYDPDAKDRGIFTLYSNNSQQTNKNEDASVPGKLWIEMFDFIGGADTNPIVKMWADAGLANRYNDAWVGFKFNWGSTGKRSYTITHTSDFGEESLPCPPVTIDTTYMHIVRLDGVFAATPGRVPIREFNLYRTTIGTDNSYVYRRVPTNPWPIQYLQNFAVNVPGAKFPHSIYVAYPGNYTGFGFRYDDDIPDKDLTQLTLESSDWDPPPLPCRGLVVGWNGILFAHWENTLFPFEPYRPHTAPSKYRIALPYKINATIVDGNSLIVLTNGPTYMVTGAHPSMLQYEVLQNTQASKEADAINGIRPPSRSAVRTPFGIAYVSDEGISLESGGRSSNLTDKLYDKITWQRRFRKYFGRMRLAYSNEKLLAFVKDDATANSIMISMESGQMSSLSGYQVRGTFALPGSDGLFIVTGNGPSLSSLYRFEDHLAPRVATRFKSKKFVFPKPVTFGCFQLFGSGTVLFTLYADGNVVFRQSVAIAGQIARLPTGVRARQWEVELALTADSVIDEFFVANTPLELQNA